MPEKCTKRSRPPPSGVMNPKPFSSENHLTVPVPTDDPLLLGVVGHAVHMSPGRCVRSQRGETLYIRVARAQPLRTPAAWRCLRAQFTGGGRDLVAVPRSGLPR